MNESNEKNSEEDNRQELTQKILLSFARQIAVGMVTAWPQLFKERITLSSG